MNFLRSLFTEPPTPPQRRAVRRSAPGLAAYHGSGADQKQDQIRDISAAGIYLVTDERWEPGTVVPLTLQPRDEIFESARRQITLQARAVRNGNDGIGLCFVPPDELDMDAWVRLIDSAVDESEPDDIVGQFRTADAVAFLTHIAPSAEAAVRQLIRGGLSNRRVANVVEVALKAKNKLSSCEDRAELRAHEHVVLRITEDSSWADEDSIQQLWAGLLASSCMHEPADESALFLIDLFSQLAPIHVRILVAACLRAAKTVTEMGVSASVQLTCSADEIMRISGSRDLVRIERDILHLSELGLFESRSKSSTLSLIDEANITPTSLGLELYARCHGYRGALEDFHRAEVPAAHAIH
jgi:hypothetical protein